MSEILGLLILHQRKDAFLGALQNSGNLAVCRKGIVRDFAADLNEAAQEGLFPHDAGIILDVGGGRNDLCDDADVISALLGIRIDAALHQSVDEGDQVDLSALQEHFPHGKVDFLMLGKVEIACLHHSYNVLKRLRIDENRPQDGLLRLQGKRHFAVQRVNCRFFVCHGLFPADNDVQGAGDAVIQLDGNLIATVCADGHIQ